MAAQAQRRKPTKYGRHRNLRLGVDEENAVAAMREALAEVRGVAFDDVDWAEAVRILLVENEKAARVMAGQPEALATAGAASVAVPDEVWESLTDCRNRTSHSQGSLYTIMKKLNFGDAVTKQQVAEAARDVKESKEAILRMEELLIEFVESERAV
ncbi:hypothetical protein [Nesterenkonia aerolata]|uniref:Uncharacterized protein n=1 Tax=Nesterenkonia aerolata TaxID=3074079 RepID=A0ABU2DRU5_9MICC|nr:hypothetical protein [Nesterenkonia sp. LY-0111]MDR8019233.1 hypothetical protein [Nesterenkonia sp. LY-0111]